MRKVLRDINIVLDLLLNRLPWANDAAVIWAAHTNSKVDAFLAAFSVPTIFYIVRKQTNVATAQNAVRDCLATLGIVAVNKATLELAQTFPNPDFEDNVQIACAVEAGADALITRDAAGWTGSPVPVLSAADLCVRLVGGTGP